MRKNNGLLKILALTGGGASPTGTKRITSNGIYNVSEYAEAEVEVPTSAADFFITTQIKPNQYGRANASMFIKKLPAIDTANITDFSWFFSGMSNLEEIPNIDTSKLDKCTGMFSDCLKIRKVPFLDIGKAKDLTSMFRNCRSLERLPLFDTSNATIISDMFERAKLDTLPNFNFSRVRSVGSSFRYARINTIPDLDWSSASSGSYAFDGCHIDKLGVIDMSGMTDIIDMMLSGSINHIGGFKNLGKSYRTNHSEGSPWQSLDCSQMSSESNNHENQLNIVKNVYDIKSINVKPQNLIFRNIKEQQLTPEEILIATNKGWNVVYR